MRRKAFGMKTLADRASAAANLLAPGRYKPISKPPLAATENLRNSRRSIWRVLILLLLWTSCRQPGESPCGFAGRYRSDIHCPSLPGRCPHRSVADFRVTRPPRSSVVPIDNNRIAVRLRQSKHAARDDLRRARALRWSSPPCLLPATRAPRTTV